MPSNGVRAAGKTWINSSKRSDEFLRVRLAVMPALEGSLHRSREALLTMDLDGIERGTREQVGLIGELKTAAQPKPRSGESGQPQENREPVFSVSPAELQELRQTESRIREAARLQAALLARARYKLRVLANMLGGLSKSYRPR